MIIVLAMHGMIPRDFPAGEKREFLRLHTQLDFSSNQTDKNLKRRHDELDEKMRRWPRTQKNDSYYFASCRLAAQLKSLSKSEVIVSFNEFCAPSVEEALNQAAAADTGEVFVVTPMLTRGGSHAEEEIPEIVDAARKRHPHAVFTYAWPFDDEMIARFLMNQLNRFVAGPHR